MTLQLPYHKTTEKAYLLLACLLGISITVSTAATNGLSIILIILFILSGDYRTKLTVLKQPYVWPFIVIIVVTLLSTLYSPISLAEKIEWFDKTRKLFIVWIIAYLCIKLTGSQMYFLISIALGIAMNFIAMLANYYFFSSENFIEFSSASYPLAQSPLLISFALIISAFISLHQFFVNTNSRIKYGGFVLGLILLFSELLINFNRTGYLMMFSAGFLFLFLHFRWKGIVLMSLLSAISIVTLYTNNEHFAKRIDMTITNTSAYWYGENTDTSVGHRLGFYRTTIALFIYQPTRLWYGFGTGSQKTVSTQFIERLPETERKFYQVFKNPHNQFLFFLLQSGLLLVLFLGWFIIRLFYMAQYLDEQRKMIMLIFNVCFLIACLFNTCLLDMGTGFFIAFGLPVLLSYLTIQKNNSSSVAFSTS